MSKARHSKPKESGSGNPRLVWAIICGVLGLVCAVAAAGILLGWFRLPFLLPFFSSEGTAASTTVAATTTTASVLPTTPTQPTPSTTTPPAVQAEGYKQNKLTEWNLLLVNRWNVIPADYEEATTFVNYDSENQIRQEVRSHLERFLIAAGEQGLWGTVLYQDEKTQQDTWDDAVEELMEEGMSQAEAEVAVVEDGYVRPGTSDHQTGMALDIMGYGLSANDVSGYENSESYKWLIENCAEYGFILRYPKGKEAITGRDYEPWHDRYVGVEHAKKIMERGITLEEYLAENNW